jgi:hypothetical protein
MTTRQLTSRPFSLDESNSNSEILTLDGYDQTPLWAKVTNIGWTVSLEMEPRLLVRSFSPYMSKGAILDEGVIAEVGGW